MALSVEVIKILIFLLPGFITYFVRRFFIIPEKKEVLEIVALSLIFSFLNYYVIINVMKLPQFENKTEITSEKIEEIDLEDINKGGEEIVIEEYEKEANDISIPGIFWSQFQSQGEIYLFIIPILLGILLGLSTNLKKIKPFKKIFEKFFKKKGYRYVWTEALYLLQDNWVLVHLKNGQKFYGRIENFSDDPSNKEIFLGNAVEISKDQTMRKIEGPGIMLTKDSEIVNIEFWSDKEKTT